MSKSEKFVPDSDTGLSKVQKTEVQNMILKAILAGSAVFALLGFLITHVFLPASVRKAESVVSDAETKLNELSKQASVDGWPAMISCQDGNEYPKEMRYFWLNYSESKSEQFILVYERHFNAKESGARYQIKFDVKSGVVLSTPGYKNLESTCSKDSNISEIIKMGQAYGVLSYSIPKDEVK